MSGIVLPGPTSDRPPPKRGSLKSISRASFSGVVLDADGAECSDEDEDEQIGAKTSAVRFGDAVHVEAREYGVTPPASPSESGSSSPGSSPGSGPEDAPKAFGSWNGSPPRRKPPKPKEKEASDEEDNEDSSDDEDHVGHRAQGAVSFRVLRSLQAMDRVMEPKVGKVESALQNLGRARAHKAWCRRGVLSGFESGREEADKLKDDLHSRLESMGYLDSDDEECSPIESPEVVMTKDRSCQEFTARAAQAEALLKVESAELELRAVRAELGLRAVRAEQELAAMQASIIHSAR